MQKSQPKVGSKSVQSRPKVGPKSIKVRPKVVLKSAQRRSKVGPNFAQSRSKVGRELPPSHPPLVPDRLVQKLHPSCSLSDALDPPSLVIHGEGLNCEMQSKVWDELRKNVRSLFGLSKSNSFRQGKSVPAGRPNDTTRSQMIGEAGQLSVGTWVRGRIAPWLRSHVATWPRSHIAT